MNMYLNAGFVGVLRRDDYQKHYKALPKPRNPPEDSAYGVLLRACVSFSLAIIAYQLNDEVQNEVVNFIPRKKVALRRTTRVSFSSGFRSDPLADPILRGMLGELIFCG